MSSTSKLRSRLLLIDTCTILEAYVLHVWHPLVTECRIAVPETVVEETIQEGRHYDEFDVDIEDQIAAGQIEVPSVDASELLVVRSVCGPMFAGDIDPGELECLACLLKDNEGMSLVCSSDRVVFRFLGWVGQPERGISLEEVLESVGVRTTAQLAWRLTKAFRERYSNQGSQEALQKGFLKL